MDKRLLLLIFYFSTIYNCTIAQTFSGSGGAIPNNNSTIDFNISVSGIATSINTLSYGLETACINITHGNDADLNISLVAPDGTIIDLSSGNGGSGNNYQGTCFNQSAATSILNGTAPFSGSYKPEGNLAMVNDGQNPNAIWKLRIHDTQPIINAGTLNSWSITFSNNPATVFNLTSTNLPIVVLNTYGQVIPNDPKITIHMGIIDNGPGMINHVTDSFNIYNSTIGIELRGQTSLGFPQLQYAVETRDALGNDSAVTLLGMPSESDWILYAPYDDKSCMRNSLTYQLSNQMGRYAVRSRYCELVLNGFYQGIYALTENIKRDSNRVDIAKLTVNDTTGDALTGGYIVKIDKVDGPAWASTHLPDQTNTGSNVIYYQMTYPKSSVILPVQQNYITQYVDSFEDALAAPNFTDPANGWRKYADENSFIDFFILNEISKNVDGYRISTYFYKDKASKGGKLFMGPIWDYNIAWHNADYCNNQPSANWAYRVTDYCGVDVPFWWKKFMTDTQFKNKLKCRWTDMRTTVLDTTNIFQYVDSIAGLLSQASARHFYLWPILGTYVWPNPTPLATTYQQEINNMKQWIVARLAWLDANMPGICNPAGEQELFSSNEFVVYPNPATNSIIINAFHNFKSNAAIIFYDATGRKVLNFNYDRNIGNDSYSLNIAELPKGVYFINVYDGNVSIGINKLVKL